MPTLPWSGDGVAISYADCPGGTVPDDVYARACIHSLEEALQCCARIGYPAMLKASWGGGGKGIRKVRRAGGGWEVGGGRAPWDGLSLY